MYKLINLIGKQFGRLIVIKQTRKDKWRHHYWLCKCSCGNKTIVLDSNLKSGCIKSCGCLLKEITSQRFTKHGHLKNKEITGIYSSWRDMIRRCTSPNRKNYKYYGDRGIVVCKRWMEFSNFLKDMENEWRPELTIERKDNNKGYFPRNCRWATKKQQARNRRNNHLETFNGKTQCLAEWSEEVGIPARIIQQRISRGWMPEKTLTTPVRKKRKK